MFVELALRARFTHIASVLPAIDGELSDNSDKFSIDTS